MNKKTAVFSVVMAVVVLAMLEGLFFAAGKVLQRKWGMWSPPRPAQTAKAPVTYEQYLQRRDPVLGWPYPEEYGANLGKNGALPNPHFPNGPLGPSCLSLYGDSFTMGVDDTTSPDKAWSNVLTAKLGCYVANFGMGGYGTDQALLRFEGNRTDDAPVVILGVHTENVMRNLTRIRDLQNYQSWFALKPRFVFNEQRQIELVAIPTLTKEQYLRATGIAAPLLALEHENFQPGGAAGAVALEFPFTLAVVKNLVRFHALHARLRKQPEWMAFLQPGHPLHGLETTVGITARFAESATQRGKSPLVVIFPHPQDFRYFVANGAWPYRPLVQAYTQAAIPYLDFGPYLISQWKERGGSLDVYFGKSAHYTDDGSALVAKAVHERMRDLRLAPSGR